MGSLETCTHVILMPESHNLALVFSGTMYTLITILTCTNFNLVLIFFSPYHMFIHDDDNAVASIFPSLSGYS